jgi:1-deoxy-D-xylulose-5-phosphate reductoisomerase
MSTQRITILGATGSIGTNTLDVIERHRERFTVYALSGRHRIEALAQQCEQFRPARAVVDDAVAAKRLDRLVRVPGMQIDYGADALCEVAREADTVMAAIVGSAGLAAALAAARAGRRILLANKEALVMAGAMFMDAVHANGATLLPIDSEHNAVFQCLPRADRINGVQPGVHHITLTASGGPFRTFSVAQMATVTPDQACAHPNWLMGRKISVDSATMMNKGLEVIEAHWLFNLGPEQIEVVIHPQSVIHSMVAYVDGSVIAQLGNPDMRTPIAYALGYPERIEAGVALLDLTKVGRLDFESPDLSRFPCLAMAYQALAAGGSAPAVLNAANEVAVAAFLQNEIRFTAIAEVVARTLEKLAVQPVDALEQLMHVDASARVCAMDICKELT